MNVDWPCPRTCAGVSQQTAIDWASCFDILSGVFRLSFWPLAVLFTLALSGGGMLCGTHDHGSDGAHSGHRHSALGDHGHHSHHHDEHHHGDSDGHTRTSDPAQHSHCCGSHDHHPSQHQWVGVLPSRPFSTIQRENTGQFPAAFLPSQDFYPSLARRVRPPPCPHTDPFPSYLRTVVLLI